MAGITRCDEIVRLIDSALLDHQPVAPPIPAASPGPAPTELRRRAAPHDPAPTEPRRRWLPAWMHGRGRSPHRTAALAPEREAGAVSREAG